MPGCAWEGDTNDDVKTLCDKIRLKNGPLQLCGCTTDMTRLMLKKIVPAALSEYP